MIFTDLKLYKSGKFKLGKKLNCEIGTYKSYSQVTLRPDRPSSFILYYYADYCKIFFHLQKKIVSSDYSLHLLLGFKTTRTIVQCAVRTAQCGSHSQVKNIRTRTVSSQFIWALFFDYWAKKNFFLNFKKHSQKSKNGVQMNSAGAMRTTFLLFGLARASVGRPAQIDSTIDFQLQFTCT